MSGPCKLKVGVSGSKYPWGCKVGLSGSEGLVRVQIGHVRVRGVRADARWACRDLSGCEVGCLGSCGREVGVRV